MKETEKYIDSLIFRRVNFTTGTTTLAWNVHIPDTPYWFPCGVLIHCEPNDEPYIWMNSDYVFEFLVDDEKDVMHEYSCFTPDLIDDRITLDAPDCMVKLDGCQTTQTTLENFVGANGGWEFSCPSCTEKMVGSQ